MAIGEFNSINPNTFLSIQDLPFLSSIKKEIEKSIKSMVKNKEQSVNGTNGQNPKIRNPANIGKNTQDSKSIKTNIKLKFKLIIPENNTEQH